MISLKEIFEYCYDNSGSWQYVPTSVMDTNDLYETPLHTICSRGKFEYAKFLLEAGADPNAKGDLGMTPIYNILRYASQMPNRVQMLELLIKFGADNRYPGYLGNPLEYYSHKNPQDPVIVKLFRKRQGF